MFAAELFKSAELAIAELVIKTERLKTERIEKGVLAATLTGTVSVDGRRYDFKRYFECNQIMEFSEAEGKLHPRWNRLGDGFTTADIGRDRVLVYYITGVDGGLNPRQSGGDGSKHEVISACPIPQA